MVSVKRNFFYSTILTGANYVFPLIVFPYISRVLGVANIGACNFVDSIVNYFCIFSMLGINVVGVREIAKAKQDKNELNSCFSSIFTINTILTSIALLVYIICSYSIPKLHDHIELMWIGAINYVLIIFW
jgi:O-antigen/teichoic acid export membrane protein